MSETKTLRLRVYPLPWEWEEHELSTGFSSIIYDANGKRPSLDHLHKDEAAVIVNAVNAAPAMAEALANLLNQVIHWGDDRQLKAIAAEISAAEDALARAHGETK